MSVITFSFLVARWFALLSCFDSVLGCALQTKTNRGKLTLALHWTLQN